MNFEDDRESGRGRKPATSTDGQQPDSPKYSKKRRGSSPEVGHALRAAYQRTIAEDIPPEMLDLLGKLG